MAVASASEKLFSRFKITAYDFDPGVTTPVDVAWVDLQEYLGIAVLFIRTIGTGATDGFDILANPASDGSGTDVEIKAHAIASEPNLIADLIVLEATAEEVGGAGTNLRYVSGSVEFATGTDEAIVVYVRGPAAFARTGLTADVIA